MACAPARGVLGLSAVWCVPRGLVLLAGRGSVAVVYAAVGGRLGSFLIWAIIGEKIVEFQLTPCISTHSCSGWVGEVGSFSQTVSPPAPPARLF